MNETVYRAPERIDGTSYTKVENELMELIEGGAETIVFDMIDIKYISSAGLRVLLNTHKKLGNSGELVLANVPGAVREILDMTGFSGMLSIR